MKRSILAIALLLLTGAGAARAAGPLLTTDDAVPVPYTWDSSQPILIFTDGGEAFTFDFDGVTPFITIERADQITEFAFGQWSDVATSTFDAFVAGTIESQIGIADVTGANAAQIYNQQNGYGFWVLYDTDGSILEEFFGVSRDSVLGIAFPEWATEDGEIVEATAVMNGWNVSVDDPDGNFVAGVFTHEFGHAINLSHSQVNGQLAYFSETFSPLYPGVPGCGVDPVHRWDLPPGPTANPADPAIIETMFPFINHVAQAGQEQSTVDHPDDIAGISNLYPTPDYLSGTGTISGVLRLKDGKTEYSGINVIARNVNDPLFDAVSDMSGSATQGKAGPDGRFTINNLTPGEQYVLYVEEIVAGGYPTAPMALISEAEYWNAAEGSDPIADAACDATPIVATAGATTSADMTFNGYVKGVEFTPIVSAFLLDMAKNGRSSAGQADTTAFIWDANKDFLVLPPDFVAFNPSIDRNGRRLLVQADLDGNGIGEPVIWSQNSVTPLGSLNGDTCGGSSSSGVHAATGWALDDAGRTAVGLAYVDQDGDGSCQRQGANEILPFIWDADGGMRQLDVSGFSSTPQFVRAHAISGNGRVALGTAGFSDAVAWIDDGPLINLGDLTGAREVYASSYDGSEVAMLGDEGVLVWNPDLGTGPEAFTNIASLRWCHDVPFLQFGQNLCEIADEQTITEMFGPVPVMPFDMSDDGSVIVGRAGDFFMGFRGALWIEDIGWMTFDDFLAEQGVVEAVNVPFNNPIAMSGSGSEVVGGIAGSAFSWLIEVDQVYVCEDGESVQTGFPNGLRDKIADGAQLGRCEHLDG